MHDKSFLVYTKTVDTAFRALRLAAYTRDIQCYSLIHLHLRRTSDAKFALSYEQNDFPLWCRSNKEMSQIIKRAVPEIHEEGDEIRLGSLNW